jgi:ligand-binding SRPBCC domain-containing protein
MPYRLEFLQWVSYPIEQVFFFLADPRNLPRIMPPSTDTRIEHLSLVPPPPAPHAKSVNHATAHLAGIGSEIVSSFRAGFLPLRQRWIARITEFEWNHHFADIQVEGPFQSWLHRHELTRQARDGVRGTRVSDRIEYEIGYGMLGNLAQGLVEGEMKSTFAHRQRALEKLLRETALGTGEDERDPT